MHLNNSEKEIDEDARKLLICI